MKKNLHLFVLIWILTFLSTGCYATELPQISADQVTDAEAVRLYEQSLSYYNSQDYENAIALASGALDIARANANHERMINIHEVLGVYYSDFSDYEKSVMHLTKALELAEVAGDEKVLQSVNLNLGTTYVEASAYSKGIAFLRKSYDYFQQHASQKPQFLIASCTNMGVGYKGLGYADSAMMYYQKAVEFSRKYADDSYSAGPLLNIGELYNMQGENEKALGYVQEALSLFKAEGNTRGYWHAGFEAAHAVAGIHPNHEVADSLKALAAHFREVNDLNYLGKSLAALKNLYVRMEEYRKALEYTEKLMDVKDENAEAEILNKISELEMQNRIKHLQAENRLRLQQMEQENRLASYKWIVATGLLLILLLIFLILYNRKKHQKQLVDSRLKTSRLEQEKLSNELEFRDKELENFALHIVQKNEFLNDIKAELKLLKGNASTKNADRIKELSMKLNQSLRLNKEIEIFRKRVEEVNHRFFYLLSEKYPDLTENEKRLCALLKLGLSSKEIASLNEISIGAVTMARYRLRKKIGMARDESFADFFRELR
jgi:tetratricopeptide (TPR) repeat protein